MSDLYVGMDPGADGAIHWYVDDSRRGTILLEEMMEAGELRYAQLVLRLRGSTAGVVGNGTAHIAVERLLPSRTSSTTSFRMGYSQGQLRALAQDANTWGPYRMYTPTPQQWQKAICRDAGVVLKKGESKSASIAACSKLFPRLELTWGRRKKPHDGLADAACLARFAYMKAHGLA